MLFITIKVRRPHPRGGVKNNVTHAQDPTPQQRVLFMAPVSALRPTARLFARMRHKTVANTKTHEKRFDSKFESKYTFAYAFTYTTTFVYV